MERPSPSHLAWRRAREALDNPTPSTWYPGELRSRPFWPTRICHPRPDLNPSPFWGEKGDPPKGVVVLVSDGFTTEPIFAGRFLAIALEDDWLCLHGETRPRHWEDEWRRLPVLDGPDLTLEDLDGPEPREKLGPLEDDTEGVPAPRDGTLIEITSTNFFVQAYYDTQIGSWVSVNFTTGTIFALDDKLDPWSWRPLKEKRPAWELDERRKLINQLKWAYDELLQDGHNTKPTSYFGFQIQEEDSNPRNH